MIKFKSKEGDRKRGRRSLIFKIHPEMTGVSVDEHIKAIFKNVVAKYMFSSSHIPITELYASMVMDYFSEVVTVDGKQVRRVLPYNKRPTIYQFRYWLYKNRISDYIRKNGRRDDKEN